MTRFRKFSYFYHRFPHPKVRMAWHTCYSRSLVGDAQTSGTPVQYEENVEGQVSSDNMKEQVSRDKWQLNHPYSVSNEECATQLAQFLKKKMNFNHPGSVVINFHAGQGLLAKAMLDSGAEKVYAFEYRREFIETLQSLESAYPGRLNFSKVSLFSEPLLAGVRETLVDASTVGASEESPLRIVGSFPSKTTSSSVAQLLFQLVEQRNIYAYGNVPVYLFLPHMEVKILTNPELYWTAHSQAITVSRSAFYQLFFKSEVLGKVPIEGFCPPLVRIYRRDPSLDLNHLYIVKLLPNLDAVNSVPDPMTFVKLLQQIVRRPKSRLVPVMDQWFPEMGAMLLRMGYSMHDTMHMVSPADWLHIYQTFTAKSHDVGSFLDVLSGREAHMPEGDVIDMHTGAWTGEDASPQQHDDDDHDDEEHELGHES